MSRLKLIITNLLIILLMFIVTNSFAEVENKNAVIYNGKYADKDSTKAITQLAKNAGYSVVYFSKAKDLPSKLSDAAIVIVGGTEDEINPLIKSFTAKIKKSLKEFINNGGLYLGICGGAYLASKGWEENDEFFKAVGLLPIETDAYLTSAKPEIIKIKWKNNPRTIYYQFGPKFLVEKSDNVKIIATYDDNSVAALMGKVGKGKVYLIGPHPEAKDDWIEEEVKNPSLWKSTTDLAEDMFNDLKAE